MDNDHKTTNRPPRSHTPRVGPGRSAGLTSWDEVADWYDDLLEGNPDSYQAKVLLPNLLRLVAPRAGMEILDLACGQGFFARAFAAKGAVVTGVDAAPALVARAAERAVAGGGSGSARFLVGEAHALSFAPDASFDAVTVVLALQNLAPYAETLREVARVLRPDGTAHIVLNHPAFRIPHASEWGWDAEKGVQYRREDRYLSELKVPIRMHPGNAPEVETLSFHRPLQAYFKAFEKAGLVVARLEEWSSHKKSDPGPRASAENRARAEFPLFLYLQLQSVRRYR